MNLKKLVLAAALLIMIPAQIACATSSMLPNNSPGTVVELKKETPDFSKDPFKHWYGWWGEKKTERAMITVTRGENGWYGFEISWPRNKSQSDMWMLTAVPISKDTMQYKDCMHFLVTFNEQNPNVVEREETIHLDGTGTITVNSANEMIWRDDQDRRAGNLIFVKMDRPLGGGL